MLPAIGAETKQRRYRKYVACYAGLESGDNADDKEQIGGFTEFVCGYVYVPPFDQDHAISTSIPE